MPSKLAIRVVAAVAAGVACVGCAPPLRTPAETVALYFQLLGADPARTLPLLTDAFHERHGLTIAGLEGWSWGGYENIEPIERVDPTLAPLDAVRGVDSRQAAWLLVHADPAFQRTAANLRFGIRDERVDPLEARVLADVRLWAKNAFRRGQPFEQLFFLVRDAGEPWRIDAIEQEHVQNRAMFAAYVAYPAEKTRSFVARHLPKAGSGETRR